MKRLGLVAVGCLCLASAPVAAQLGSGGGREAAPPPPTSGAQTGSRPPAPNKPASPPRWLYYLVVVALGGATIGLSIMPSKRGHQD